MKKKVFFYIKKGFFYVKKVVFFYVKKGFFYAKRNPRPLGIFILAILVPAIAHYFHTKLPGLIGVFRVNLVLLLSWILGIGLLGWHLYSKEEKQGEPGITPLRDKRIWGMLLLIFLIATFFRTYQLGSIPPTVRMDEQWGMKTANWTRYGYYLNPFMHIMGGIEALECWWMGFFMHFINDTVIAARLAHVVFGIAVVVALFLMVREFANTWTALLASFFMAVLDWMVGISRATSYVYIIDLFFFILTLYFLARWMKTERRFDLFRCAVSMSIAVILNHYGVLLPLVVIPSMGYILWKKGLRREGVRDLAFLLGVAALVFWPRLLEFFRTHGPWWINQTILGSIGVENIFIIMLKNFKTALAYLFLRLPDELMYSNTIFVSQHLIALPLMIFFVIGWAKSLIQIQKPKNLILNLTIFIMVLTVCGLTIKFRPRRLLGTVPVILTLSAVGLKTLFDTLGKSKLFPRVVRYGGLILFCGWLGITSYHNYFHSFIRDDKAFDRWRIWWSTGTVMGRELVRYRDSYQTYVSYSRGFTKEFRQSYKLMWKVAWRKGEKWAKMSELPDLLDLPLHEPIEKDVVFIVENSFFGPHYRIYDSLLPLLRHYYPKGRVEKDLSDPLGRRVGYVYVVSKEEARELQGLTGCYYQGSELKGKLLLIRIDPLINFTWEGGEFPFTGPLAIYWEGTLFVPEGGHYLFQPKTNGIVTIKVDGKEVTPEGVYLHYGPQEISIRATFREAGENNHLSLCWKPVAGEHRLIPKEFFHAKKPYQEHGLMGEYFKGASFAGVPLFKRLDPTLSFCNQRVFPEPPFSVRWQGKIIIPYTDDYFLAPFGIGEFSVSIDGHVVTKHRADAGSDWREWWSWLNYLNRRGYYKDRYGYVRLSKGVHDIKVEYVLKKGEKKFHGTALAWISKGLEERDLNFVQSGSPGRTKRKSPSVIPMEQLLP